MRIACLQVRPFLCRGHSFLLTVKQFAPQVGDVDNNLNRADAVLSKANPKNLDLLVLPELAFSGRSCPALRMLQFASAWWWTFALEQAPAHPPTLHFGACMSSSLLTPIPQICSQESAAFPVTMDTDKI
jgi:hypothetical protein